MADERPLKLIRKKKMLKARNTELTCIIHCCNDQSKVTQLTDNSFSTIQKAKCVRLKHSRCSEDFDTIIEQLPDEYSKHEHGYHRKCYQKFTNVSKLLKRKADDDVGEGTSHGKRSRLSLDTGVLFPADKCLFCDKGRKKSKGKEEKLSRCETKTADQAIKDCASERRDHIISAKVNDKDLIAREAHYHLSCYKSFTRSERRNTTQSCHDEQAKEEQLAHSNAFKYLIIYIEESLIKKGNVERLSMLKEKYLTFLQDNHIEYYNPNYKTYKLKQKIVKHFGSSIEFWQPNYRSELVYSSSVMQGQAVEAAFEAAASEGKRLEEASMVLRRIILSAKKEAPQMPWPIPPGNQLKKYDSPPKELLDFIANLFCGEKSECASLDQFRTILSVSRDIMYAVTRGRWMTSKHVLLGMSLWHITGRADVVKLVNRFGHCVSYSRLLEILTGIQISIKDHNSRTPPGIVATGNEVIHFCWDNFDLNEETLSGAGTTHSTHGLVIQEKVSTAVEVLEEPQTSIPRSKKRSTAFEELIMEPCFVKPHTEPNFTTHMVYPPEQSPQIETVKLSDALWIICRLFSVKDGEQQVPGWGGWVSLTGGQITEEITTVEYMPPVNAPITENETVLHILKLSQEATELVGQQYTIVTFDLAAAKKAYSIIWAQQERFKNVIIRLGAFHMACAYIGAIGKHMRGSGLEEILVQSSVCASGSIDKVMNGKHYNRARLVFRVVVEALERIIWHSFEKEINPNVNDKTRNLLMELANDPTSAHMEDVRQDRHCQELLAHFDEYRINIRHGVKGKTAQFWMCFIDMCWTLFRFLRATKQNDLALHIACLNDMCPLFFSQEKPNYARYTVLYLNTLMNLPTSHPGAWELLEKKGFTVNRSEIPNSRNAVDITIEQTYNRHASGQGPGIVGFSRNFAAYHRWSSTRHARAGYLQATLESAGLGDDDTINKHKDMNRGEILKGEDAVQRMIVAFENFVNPFSIEDNENLYCVSSGKFVPPDATSDLLDVLKHGQTAYHAFVQERLVEKTVSFHSPIRKLKLKTFSSIAVSKKVTSSSHKSKELTAERNLFGQLILLALNHQISLEKVLSYPLGPVPWSLATADGIPTRTDKSKLMHQLEVGHSGVEKAKHSIHVIDGNSMFHELVNIPDTFGELAYKIFVMLPKSERVDFVTDTYSDQSIKAIERQRRGVSSQQLVQGPFTKVPREFKQFLLNDNNKSQLISLIKEEWMTDRYASSLVGRKVLIVDGEKCWQLTSTDGMTTACEEVPELKSTQEEADTRIILHLFHAASHSLDGCDIVVRSPDTDVFILLMKYANEVNRRVLMDTGTGNKRRLINVSSASMQLSPGMSAALVGLHAYTGCDSTSAFVRKGKVAPLRILQRNPSLVDCFSSLGTTQELTTDQLQGLEVFTCMLYGAKSAITNINKLRHTIFTTRFTPNGQLMSNESGVDLSLLPPCASSLRMHMKRVNYQCMIWNQASVSHPVLPRPDDGHGWVLSDGQLHCQWTDGDMLPVELVDLFTEHAETPEESDYYNLQDDIVEDMEEEDE